MFEGLFSSLQFLKQILTFSVLTYFRRLPCFCCIQQEFRFFSSTLKMQAQKIQGEVLKTVKFSITEKRSIFLYHIHFAEF